MLKMTKSGLIWFLIIATIFITCKEKEKEVELAAPIITVTTDTKEYLPGDVVEISVNINAPGRLKELKIGSQILTTFENDRSLNVSSDYLIPENTPAGDHKVLIIATDKQSTPKITQVEAVIKVADINSCANFNETTVITGTGKIAISDFSAAASGLVKEIIVNNTNDQGSAGVDNPAGCGKVYKFDKKANEWDGWNGFKVILNTAFPATDFTSFARTGATKVLKVDVYRGVKAGSASFPANGLAMYVNLGNTVKYGDHPAGRSQYLIGTLTKNNQWETITFQINPANASDIDATVANNETNLIEFVPAGGVAADGGLYFFDNLRLETMSEVPTGVKTICDYTIDEAALTSAGWVKVFEDDFTSDLSKWNIWTGGAFNNELQHYQASNMTIQNGILAISAKKQTVTGATTPFDATNKTFNYTSGRIESKTTFSASTATPKVRMLARIKWPNKTGLWPAFWSYGDPWPTHGEIDILESRGQEPTKYTTNYFYGTQAGTNLVHNAVGYITADNNLTTCYHVYELIWEKDKLTSYLDGKVVETKTSGGYINQLFGKSEKLVLNLAVGGDFFTNLDPATIQEGIMYVDYVKVFTSN